MQVQKRFFNIQQWLELLYIDEPSYVFASG